VIPLTELRPHLTDDEFTERLQLREAEIARECETLDSEFESPWEAWLIAVFPEYLTASLAEFHHDFWEWLWQIRPGLRPESFVGIWARGAAKSTSAELGCVALGARNRRRFGLYVCETQDQANDHLATIATMLESPRVGRIYPQLGERAMSKWGQAKGWNLKRLRCASGFTIDALGLDAAARGVKVDDARPDFMVLDDLDSEHDTPAATAKKIKTITRKLIPAGGNDLAVLAIQNLVAPDSIFAQFADDRAEFLGRRIVSGPHPAIAGLAIEDRDGRATITAGEATWEGMSVERCQEMLDDEGETAFRSERQHETEPPPGGMFDHVDFAHVDWDVALLVRMVRLVVWVDPAVTNTDESDCQAIQCDGIDSSGVIYRFFSWEQRATPRETLGKAITKALEYGADVVGVETDQGGDTWESVYREACNDVELEDGEQYPPFEQAKAGQGQGSKVERAQRMLADYERPGPRVVHVNGSCAVLERALRRFPRTKPYDLTDASYWAWHDLREPKQRRRLRP
jgi:hypothetical protein